MLYDGPAQRERREAAQDAQKIEQTNARKSVGLFIGCDLGKSHDYTTAITLEKIKITKFDRWVEAPPSTKVDLNNPMSELQPTFTHDIFYGVRKVDRVRLGTSYVEVTRFLLNLINKKGIKGLRPTVVLDRTGIGAAVIDFLVEGGVSDIIGITATGGSTITEDDNLWTVPKSELVTMTKSCFGRGILKIAETDNSDLLLAELKQFMIRRSPSGNLQYEAPSGEHDDLVSGLMLALWAATRYEPIPLVAPTVILRDFGDGLRRGARVRRSSYNMSNKGYRGGYY
jgi:hypothetical protein